MPGAGAVNGVELEGIVADDGEAVGLVSEDGIEVLFFRSEVGGVEVGGQFEPSLPVVGDVEVILIAKGEFGGSVVMGSDVEDAVACDAGAGALHRGRGEGDGADCGLTAVEIPASVDGEGCLILLAGIEDCEE